MDVILRKRGGAYQIWGVDIEPIFLEEARRRHPKEEFPMISFVEGNGEELAFEDGSMDYIRIERMIQHQVKPEQVFGEAVRVLKPGSGVMVVVDTDWALVSFGTTFLELEQRLVKTKIEHDLNNGLASRTLLTYIQSPLQATYKRFRCKLDSYEMGLHLWH